MNSHRHIAASQKAARSATGSKIATLDDSLPTKVKLMIVAERLFGEFGIDAVPLRMISKEAAQKNTNSVQYHFGGRLPLLRAIFEYREAQLDPARKTMLVQGEAQDKLSDVRWLLRICFEPNFHHYNENNGINYIKLHAQYLSSLRPRGAPHPVDDESPSTESFRKAIQLLRQRLAFLDEQRFMSRLESVGTMFLGAVIQHAARPMSTKVLAYRLFDDVLEMMTSAICTPPWDVHGGQQNDTPLASTEE